MLRAFNACLVLVVLTAAYVLYSLEHSIRGVERRIARANAQIASERETIGFLNAEWSSLVRPERLQPAWFVREKREAVTAEIEDLLVL